MPIRLLLSAAIAAAVSAFPAVAGAAHHGGSGIVGATRVGDLEMGVSTEADVRAFAGNPDVVDDHHPYRWTKQLGYNCRERDDCRTTYELNRDSDRLFGFATYSKQFRTRRGTRVGDTRSRAERNERRKANRKLCGGTRAIVYSDSLWIFFYQRRVWSIVVGGSYLDC